MGAPDDMQLLRAIRESTRQVLRVDANEGWTFDGALERLAELARLGVEFVEQPLPAAQVDAIRELRQQSPLPFIADESVHDAADIPKLAGAFDGINLKLAKCGGIAPALEIIAVARAHGMKILLGCMIESSLGIAAALSVAPLVDWLDLAATCSSPTIHHGLDSPRPARSVRASRASCRTAGELVGGLPRLSGG
jgi:L-alanine-DL-glutamate epimerase-like enolase superfamily enzyme